MLNPIGAPMQGQLPFIDASRPFVDHFTNLKKKEDVASPPVLFPYLAIYDSTGDLNRPRELILFGLSIAARVFKQIA
ncbi:MAG: hypothetical protein IPJ30_25850 [Acidobacteria bacterium]|nr:hypothetical protein [Acidobacteriota bacterium]